MTSLIQVRTDPTTKQHAQAILAKLGLDLSTAINIYLMQIIYREGIPFQILTENGMTLEKEKELDAAIRSANRSRKSYSSAEEMAKDILKG